MKEDKYAFVDKWRPSRVRAVTKGELCWTEVDILDISDISTSTAIRAGLEPFDVRVNYFSAGLAEHIKKVLGSSDYAKAPYLIITAHGAETDGDISMGGELAGEIAATQDFDGTMTAEDLKKFVDVKDKIIINTACIGGDAKLANAFIKEGHAKAYIGDTSAPFAYTSFLFPILIFYFLTHNPDFTIQQAFERAKATDSGEFKTWQLFE